TGPQALTVLADALFHLFPAGWMAKICGGAAHIMDISFKLRVFGEGFRFLKHRFLAAYLHNSSLMNSQGAEAASAETAAAAGQTEFRFRKSRDASKRIIGRMGFPHIGQTVEVIHFHGG